MSTDFSDSYQLRRIVLLAAAASSTLIFVFLFFQSISYHNVFGLGVVDEMVAYTEFFLFSYTSYFLVAMLVWKYKVVFEKYVAPWLLISFLGSAFFCAAFSARVYIDELITYQEGDPFKSPPQLVEIAASALIATPVLTFIVSIFTALTSSVYVALENRKH